ncbi:MAG: PLP-dependent transferase [Caldilineaceae bacterium]
MCSLRSTIRWLRPSAQPLTYGIDLVHSVTKYLGGRNDLMAGAIVGSYRLIDRLRQAQALLGHVVDPRAAYLILRGTKTLALCAAKRQWAGRSPLSGRAPQSAASGIRD